MDHGQREFLYHQLAADPNTFRNRYEVDEESFWEMLGYVHEQYEESLRRNSRDNKQYQQQQGSETIRWASREIVNQRIADPKSRERARNALLRILGRAGGNAAYLEWRQPALPYAMSSR